MSMSIYKESARLHQRISAVAQNKNPHGVVLNTLLQISPGVRKNYYLLRNAIFDFLVFRQRKNKRDTWSSCYL